MMFILRCAVLTLAAFGLAAIIASGTVGLTWCLRRGQLTSEGTAAARADTLLRLRLWPSIVAIVIGAFTAIGLWRFESSDAHEVIGWTLRGGATLGALVLATFATRLWRLHLETRSLLTTWLAGATPLPLGDLPGPPDLDVPAYRIETHFPVVAVVGVFRPTLVVDGSVLDACSPEELSAILAHEGGHIRRWDNLRRALFAATPDLLAWTSAGPALREAWREATEEAADDVAAATDGQMRNHLAGALIRVARTARESTSDASTTFRARRLPASALYRGGSVERRVRRLFEPPEPDRPAGRRWGLAAAISTLAVAFMLQQEIHTLMEVAISGLW